MTFYEASVAARRRIEGGITAVATARRTARSTSTGPFRHHARGWLACCSASFLRREISTIIRARIASGDERDRSVGTSEHTDRASDLLRRKRERVSLSEQEWPSAERERVASEGEDIDEQ
jgi:hypothetical protein